MYVFAIDMRRQSDHNYRWLASVEDLCYFDPHVGQFAAPPCTYLEALKGNRKGQHSIRINDQWRLCFQWQSDGAYQVEIVDYH